MASTICARRIRSRAVHVVKRLFFSYCRLFCAMTAAVPSAGGGFPGCTGRINGTAELR